MLIDFHAHAFLDKLAAGAVSSLAARAHLQPFTDGTVKGAKELMAQQGVDRFVVLNIAVSPRTERHVNDFAISLLGEKNIIPFGSVHPDSENALKELDRLKSAGIKGIKFHNEYQNFMWMTKKRFPSMKSARNSDLSCCFTAGWTEASEIPLKRRPSGFEKFGSVFPKRRSWRRIWEVRI